MRWFRKPNPTEVAQARLAAMVAARARSPDIVDFRKRREAALRGTSRTVDSKAKSAH